MNAPELTVKVTELSQRLDKVSELVNALQLQLANLTPEARAAGLAASETGSSVVRLERMIGIIETQIRGMDHLKQQPEAVSDLKAEMQTKTALLQREVEELKKWQAERKQEEKDSRSRMWMLVPPTVAAVLSSSLTVLLTLLISKLNK